METDEEARAIARGVIDLQVCAHCGFVFNAAFDPDKLAYGSRYDNTQDCSPTFAAYASSLATEVRRSAPSAATIVELGCGKGAFIRGLIEASPMWLGLGFDPSYEGDAVVCDGRLRFERRFFDAQATIDDVDIVICRHVIEHVPRPVAMLTALRAALERSPRAQLYFETPCVEWIFRNRVVWDVFYEHCSYFSTSSLSYAFAAAGFSVQAVRHVFEGQYLWLVATPARQSQEPPVHSGEPPQAREFARDFRSIVGRWRAAAASAGARGGVAAWGAGAKGVTLANLIDPDQTLMDCLIDLNPRKQGRFVPGTGHPIVSPQVAAQRGVRTALLMNPNYRDENETLIKAANLPIRFVS